MIDYCVYDPATGRVLRSGRCWYDDLSLQAGAGEAVIAEAANDTAQYVMGGVVVARPGFPATWDKSTIAANGIDKARLSILPNPSIISINAPVNMGIASVPDQTVTDGVFEISATVIGGYDVTATAWPYLDFKVTINAI